MNLVSRCDHSVGKVQINKPSLLRPSPKAYLPVPITHILSGASKLIPQAHANHIGDTIKEGGHLC